MHWNWTQAGWPQFAYDLEALAPLERQFLKSLGEIIGAVRHVDDEDSQSLRIELLSDDALKTSEIEGETLDRQSVQSSLRWHSMLMAGNRHLATVGGYQTHEDAMQIVPARFPRSRCSDRPNPENAP